MRKGAEFESNSEGNFSFLKQETTERIRDEVGEDWLPLSEELERLNVIYGTQYHLMTRGDVERLREMNPLYSHPIYDNAIMNLVTPAEAQALYQDAQKKLIAFIRALKIWEEEGVNYRFMDIISSEE